MPSALCQIDHFWFSYIIGIVADARGNARTAAQLERVS